MLLSETHQFLLLKDCFAQRLLSFPDFQNSALQTTDLDSGLDDFATYLEQEVWPSLPAPLREASHDNKSHIPDDLRTSRTILTPSTSRRLRSPSPTRWVLREYVASATAPLPVWSQTRTSQCEICDRAVPLTYHHLIPRSTHAKALKKKWHLPSMLNSVAWLCRPCHTVVHQVASNEALAQHFYTVDLLLERDDIQRWGKYASKQRFGIRRG
ncbi:hypothetical protein GGX14DRAFT_577604 [Mycena pura]|uniref:HNH domain-containing protein n=1 Tax=Mycena pura TaxID=153505 RepID=A0AAD6URK5_9AGAR|nr:hypothetical protein GGX14DRAFT_577604 [Mycena pura]